MKKYTKISLLAFAFAGNAWALSPPNINTNIPWTDTGGVFQLPSTFNATFNGVTDITAAFDNARRQEEAQLGLTSNTLGTLNLPSQADWDKMTDDAKALLILNDERTDRVGMLLGVLGLPFAGIESHIDNIAKNYGDLLHDTDKTGHYWPSGDRGLDGPSFRIEQDADIGSLHATDIVYAAYPTPPTQHTNASNHYYGDSYNGNGACHEFITRSENLAAFASGGAPVRLPLERAIYNWIYSDASSSWGHREAALLQDETLAQVGSGWGFLNNHGNAGSEGFLGLYLRHSTVYQPFLPSTYSNTALVVMNIFDPVATPTSCHYNVTLDSASVSGVQGKAPTLAVPANTWAQIGLNTVPATGSTVADILGDDVTGVYGTNWAVYRYDNTVTPHAYVELTLTDTMSPGVGYWFIHVSGAVTLDVPGSSSGVYVTHTPACASTEGCFEVALEANVGAAQWQMIGYPFRDSRDMDEVRLVTNGSGACSAGCTLSAAAGLVGTTFWHFSGGAYQALTSGGANTLNAWDGVWVAILPAASGTDLKVLLPATN